MRALHVAGLAGLTFSLLSCDIGAFVEPAAQPTSMAIAYELSPAALVVAGGPAAAFDATDALSVVLSRGESIVLDTLMSFAPAAEETRVGIEVSVDSAEASYGLELTLLRGEDPIFRGRGAVTLTRGSSTPVELTLEPVPSRIELDTEVGTLGIGDTIHLSGSAVFATGHGIPEVTLAWTTEHPELVDVNATTGRVVGKAEGAARVAASFAGLDAATTVTVRSAVASVATTLAAAQLGIGGTTQATADVRDKRGNSLARQVEWSTSDAEVASVDASGVVTAVGEGTVTIAATTEGKSGSKDLVVRSGVASVGVTLAAARIGLQETTQASATVLDALGNTLDRTVAWTTSNQKVVTVGADGVVTAVAEGSATITATVEGISGSAAILVRSAVQDVMVTLSSARIGLGGTAQATASVRDGRGNVLERTVAWTTSDSNFATVDASGLVRGVREGTVTVTATVEGRSGSASLVVQSDASSVAVTLSRPEIENEETAQASAVVRDAAGNVLARTVTWSSSDDRIAVVSPAGIVTGVGEGTANISATVGGVSGSAPIRVRSCVAAPPPLLRNAFPVSASVARSSGRLVDVVLNPIIVGGRPVTGLNESNFIVVEDDCSRPFTVTTSEGAIGIDLVFIQDLSGSMGGAIAGVRTSVISLAEQLASRGLDIRIGSVGFSGPMLIPSTPAGSTTEYLGPVQDLTTPSAFQTHVTNEWFPTGGGDLPENGLEAIEYAHQNLSWRPGATRVMILITDISLHWSGSGCGCSDQTIESIAALIGGSTVVHAVAPAEAATRTSSGGVDPWRLATATGGAQLELGPNGAVDLTALQIEAVLAETIRLTFESATADNVAHDLRVRVTLPEGSASEYVAEGIRYDPLDIELRAARFLGR